MKSKKFLKSDLKKELLVGEPVDNVKNKAKKFKNILKKKTKNTIDESRRRESISNLLEMNTESSIFKNKAKKLNVEKHEHRCVNNNEPKARSIRNVFDVTSIIKSVSSKTRKKKKDAKEILCDHASKHPSEKLKIEASTFSNDIANGDLNVPVSYSVADESEISRDLRTIYVGNLPVDFKKKKLLKVLKLYGKVEKMWTRGAKPLLDLPKKVALIKRKFHENQPPLMVYIVFKTVEEAHNALKLNGELYDGCRLRVTMIKERDFDSRKAVFVGNLPFEVKDDDLFDFFLQCGEIMNVRVVRDGKTGAGKGFGYVNFKFVDSVELALNLKAEKLNGREIRVQRVLSAGKKKKLAKKLGKSLRRAVSLDKKSLPPRRRKSADVMGKRKEKSKRKVTDSKKKILAKKLSIKSRKNADSS